MIPLIPAGAVVAVLATTCVWLWLKWHSVRQRYASVVDAEATASRVLREAKAKAEGLEQAADARVSAARRDLEDLTRRYSDQQAQLSRQQEVFIAEYERTKATYDRLRGEVGALEEQLEDISYGVYRPHFTYETSASYKQALEELRTEEREMLRAGLAAVSRQVWNVGGNKRDGERLTKQYLKLMLRAFNGECDAALAKVAWNNLATMENRCRKAFEAINQLGSTLDMDLQPAFLELKSRELRLTQELEEKQQQEKEEQRRIREQMREEERVQRELAQAQTDAAREEERYERALTKARREADAAFGAEREALEAQVAALALRLAEAHAKKERAKAQAELTKCGHIYILSNAGSLGPDVYKIGMTRRLEPLDRVAELSDASVPFPFDVHAMVYTENAPTLELELHNQFWERRINLVNDRKEFFQVSLDELESHLRSRGFQVQLTKLAEAKEYRQPVALREERRLASQSSA